MASRAVEEELRRSSDELQKQVAQDAQLAKQEKAQQKVLIRDIKLLKKQYQLVTKGDKFAPTTLEGLTKQISLCEEQVQGVNAKIAEMQEEIAAQNNLLQRAQEEISDWEQHAQLRLAVDAPPPGTSYASDLSTPATTDAVGRALAATLPGPPGALGARPRPGHGDAEPTPSAPSLAPSTGGPHQPSPRSGTAHAPDHAADGQPPHRRSWSTAQDELSELVRLQTKNQEVKSEIESIMTKMQLLRKAMKKGKTAILSAEFIRNLIGLPAEEQLLEPPLEHQLLRREVRHKQKEVRALRKRWWDDHKDIDALAEKVKQLPGSSGVALGPAASGPPGSVTVSAATDWVQGLAAVGAEQRSMRAMDMAFRGVQNNPRLHAVHNAHLHNMHSGHAAVSAAPRPASLVGHGLDGASQHPKSPQHRIERDQGPRQRHSLPLYASPFTLPHQSVFSPLRPVGAGGGEAPASPLAHYSSIVTSLKQAELRKAKSFTGLFADEERTLTFGAD